LSAADVPCGVGVGFVVPAACCVPEGVGAGVFDGVGFDAVGFDAVGFDAVGFDAVGFDAAG
jgi:hypothetical protein